MKQASEDQLAKAFAALGNRHRLAIYLRLLEESQIDLSKGRTHECFLAKLLGDIRLTAPTVSHHVRELAEAGLIATEKQGKQLIVSLRSDMLEILRSTLLAKSTGKGSV